MKVILALAFVFLTCCSVADGANLYPACQGDELHSSVSAGKESTLYVLPRKSKNLTLTCLAYELTSLKGGVGKGSIDHCRVGHQTEYFHRLVVRARWKDKATRRAVVRDFDVKDQAGGSLSQVAIRLPEESSFSLVFMNLGTNERCSLQIRALMDYKQSAKETQNNRLPVVISVVPHVVFVRGALTDFVFRYPIGTRMEDIKSDVVTLSEWSQDCDDGSFDNRIMRPPSFPPSLDALPDKSTLVVRSYFFDVPETYRICYRAKGDTASSELAIVHVFDGNPSYYEIIEGQDNEGRVFVGTDATIKFYGYDLDTRPDGDRAKFARDNEDCATAKAAGGVPEATDLGPSDDYGPGTTYTLWKWKLKESGAFKICYKRHAGSWTEVPSITNLGHNNLPSENKGNSSNGENIPRPTDPVTKEECPMAPENTRERPWDSYKSLKFTLSEEKISDNFLKRLSQVFCIPRAALTVTHMTHDESGRQVLYLSIICEEIDEKHVCSTLERQNYIISLMEDNSKILHDLGIASIEGSRYMFAYGDDSFNGRNYGNHLLAVSLMCGTVLLVAAMAVYGVVKYRENRQYFIQFGTDDEDVGDMYANEDDAPAFRHQYPVKDAVIEVEE